ncbi:hypothetical protein BOM_0122 [Borrelia miyamotoi FR64b]|nr:hypothetical protein BOM_0122 [Borrelia miyamotoi FR64b]
MDLLVILSITKLISKIQKKPLKHKEIKINSEKYLKNLQNS